MGVDNWTHLYFAWPPVDVEVEWERPDGVRCINAVRDFHPLFNLAGWKWRVIPEDSETLRWRNFYCIA
jgi:hypothetical protein